MNDDAALTRELLREELDASNSYESKADATDCPKAKKVYDDIAREEKVHTGELSQLLAKQDPDGAKAQQEGMKEAENMIAKSDGFAKANRGKRSDGTYRSPMVDENEGESSNKWEGGRFTPDTPREVLLQQEFDDLVRARAVNPKDKVQVAKVMRELEKHYLDPNNEVVVPVLGKDGQQKRASTWGNGGIRMDPTANVNSKYLQYLKQKEIQDQGRPGVFGIISTTLPEEKKMSDTTAAAINASANRGGEGELAWRVIPRFNVYARENSTKRGRQNRIQFDNVLGGSVSNPDLTNTLMETISGSFAPKDVAETPAEEPPVEETVSKKKSVSSKFKIDVDSFAKGGRSNKREPRTPMNRLSQKAAEEARDAKFGVRKVLPAVWDELIGRYKEILDNIKETSQNPEEYDALLDKMTNTAVEIMMGNPDYLETLNKYVKQIGKEQGVRIKSISNINDLVSNKALFKMVTDKLGQDVKQGIDADVKKLYLPVQGTEQEQRDNAIYEQGSSADNAKGVASSVSAQSNIPLNVKGSTVDENGNPYISMGQLRHQLGSDGWEASMKPRDYVDNLLKVMEYANAHPGATNFKFQAPRGEIMFSDDGSFQSIDPRDREQLSRIAGGLRKWAEQYSEDPIINDLMQEGRYGGREADILENAEVNPTEHNLKRANEVRGIKTEATPAEKTQQMIDERKKNLRNAKAKQTRAKNIAEEEANDAMIQAQRDAKKMKVEQNIADAKKDMSAKDFKALYPDVVARDKAERAANEKLHKIGLEQQQKELEKKEELVRMINNWQGAFKIPPEDLMKEDVETLEQMFADLDPDFDKKIANMLRGMKSDSEIKAAYDKEDHVNPMETPSTPKFEIPGIETSLVPDRDIPEPPKYKPLTEKKRNKLNKEYNKVNKEYDKKDAEAKAESDKREQEKADKEIAEAKKFFATDPAKKQTKSTGRQAKPTEKVSDKTEPKTKSISFKDMLTDRIAKADEGRGAPSFSEAKLTSNPWRHVQMQVNDPIDMTPQKGVENGEGVSVHKVSGVGPVKKSVSDAELFMMAKSGDSFRSIQKNVHRRDVINNDWADRGTYIDSQQKALGRDAESQLSDVADNSTDLETPGLTETMDLASDSAAERSANKDVYGDLVSEYYDLLKVIDNAKYSTIDDDYSDRGELLELYNKIQRLKKQYAPLLASNATSPTTKSGDEHQEIKISTKD